MILLTRNRKRAWLGLALGVGLAGGAGWCHAQEETAPAQDCSAELAKLQEEHSRLLVDYKNAVAQAKALLVYKNQVRDVVDIQRQNQIQVQQVEKDKQDAQGKVAELEKRIEGLNADVVRLQQERDEYKKSFEKASVENIIGEDAKKKTASVEEERDTYKNQAQELDKRVKALEHEGLKREAETELLRRQLDEVKGKYAEAARDNRILEKKIQSAPKRAAELARENAILIKRTALMHYNLGVFYTQNREFERAIKEFEKGVELNPQDSASFFNLGYIYAEHLQNRPKAIEYFRTYLKLAKKDDKDADWAKRYILTWQSWEGSVPIR